MQKPIIITYLKNLPGFVPIRRVYGAGYRAGLCGAASTQYPGDLNFMARFLWLEGWHKGMTEHLQGWLKLRRMMGRQ